LPSAVHVPATHPFYGSDGLPIVASVEHVRGDEAPLQITIPKQAVPVPAR